MRGRVLFLFLLLALPITSYSQSTLNFPKFFSAAELPNSGFAIVNPGPTVANVTFTLYGADGSVVSTSTQTSEPPLAAGSQRAESGDQIFCVQSGTMCAPNLGTGGWVQATSTTSGLQGFWLNYDAGLTYLDGAAAAVSSAGQVIPLVAGSTDINIANVAAVPATVSIELRGADGSQLATAVSQTIAGHGVFHADAFTLFTVPDPTQALYVRVIGGSGSALAVTAMIRNYLVPVESGVVNGVDIGSTPSDQLYIPHVISGLLGGSNYTTVVGVTNLANVAQTVTIAFVAADGSSGIGHPVQLAPFGSFRDTAQHFFNLPTNVFQSGWIQITGMSPIVGFAAYANLVGGALAVVPASSSGSTSLLFAHIANLYPADPWETGIALVNPGGISANVEVYAMTPSGSLLGGATTDATAKFTLPPSNKLVQGLSQIIPEAGLTSTHSSDGGFVFVRTTNNVPIYGTELFYNPGVTILANVAGTPLASGITYTPPNPPGTPPTLTAVSPAKAVRGASITLTGTGFSTTPSNDTVIFTSAAGETTSVAPSAATATSMTLSVPTAAITGPVTVQASGQTSSALILEVLASANTFAQNAVTITAGGTTSGVDVYVDPPAAASTANILNATEIGVAALSASSIPFGEASATVTHGTQMLMLIYGTGISQANGTTVSFSGSGITASNVSYGVLNGSTYMIAQITIDSGAALGSRNVILTNSNLDVSVLSGALIIQ